MPRAVAGVDFHRRTRLAALIDVVTVWGSVKPSSTELSESGEKKTIAVNDEATHPNEARPLLWPETWKNRLRGVFFCRFSHPTSRFRLEVIQIFECEADQWALNNQEDSSVSFASQMQPKMAPLVAASTRPNLPRKSRYICLFSSIHTSQTMNFTIQVVLFIFKIYFFN